MQRQKRAGPEVMFSFRLDGEGEEYEQGTWQAERNSKLNEFEMGNWLTDHTQKALIT